jgi:hypothetical protein
VLVELVQTTAGTWITHPPTRCPNGHTLGRAKSSSDMSPASATEAADTSAGIAALRRRGLRAAVELSLHDARRACDGADFQPHLLASRACDTPVRDSNHFGHAVRLANI